jgi:hypothetical protein
MAPGGYILRNPFSVEKMTLESPGDLVIYRSRLNAKINRNFEVFTPTDFLAAITHKHGSRNQFVRCFRRHQRTVAVLPNREAVAADVSPR